MRPYYHHDDHGTGGSALSFGSRWTRTTKVLVAANVAAFLVILILSRSFPDVFEWVGFYVPNFARGAVWQPVTYMFVHAGPWHLLGNMLGLFFFGGQVERQLGTLSFLLMYFLCGVAGALLSLFQPNAMVVGASGGTLGILVAFAMLFPHARILIFFMFPIKARTLALIFAFITIVSLLGDRADGVAHWAHLGGMAVGYLWVKGRPLGRSLLAFWGARRRMMDVRRSAAEQAELDRILEKVHRDGISSLSNQERDFLNLMSRKYRDRG
ncbi:MAG TPA: rhomboid family intramembrane serine protease [Planctomycetota bacterium]|nr:rhomboid family intramembrane serine protease [Planctomycetota bacterium]